MVFNGYWNCEADNAFTFRGGWHHTGDMGRFDADGYLWYIGRSAAKELIKPGGENVYPAEVERALLEHPALSAAIVFGIVFLSGKNRPIPSDVLELRAGQMPEGRAT